MESAPTSNQFLRLITPVSLIVVLAVWLGAFVSIWFDLVQTQWDLKTYYAAASVFDQGGDPYSFEEIKNATDVSVWHPYIYPPLNLYFFKPLSGFRYQTVHRLWLILKLILVILFFWIIKLSFLRNTAWLVVLLIGSLGFGAPLFWDIKAGNVTLLEQCLLWGGFALLVRRRVLGFAVLVALASFFKIYLSVFLLLLLLPAVRSPRSIGSLAVGASIVACYILVPFVLTPEVFRDFVSATAITQGPRLSNISFFGLMNYAVAEYGDDNALLGLTPWTLWGMFAVAFLILSRKFLRQTFQSDRLEVIILAGAMVFTLIFPRMVIYSFVLFIPGALALAVPAAKMIGGKIALPLLISALCLSGLVSIYSLAGGVFAAIPPLALGLLCWILITRSRPEPAAG